MQQCRTLPLSLCHSQRLEVAVGICWPAITCKEALWKGALLIPPVALLVLFFIFLDILLIPRSHWRKLWDMTVNFQDLSIYRFLETCPSCMCSSLPTCAVSLGVFDSEILWTVACQAPLSSVHGILQARILERSAMPSSRGSFWPRNWTHTSLCFLHWQAGFFLPLAPHGKPNHIFMTKWPEKEILWKM